MATPEEQRDARAYLVGLARIARSQGMSRHAWLEYMEEPRDVCRAAGLDPSLLEHIAVFVWTFRKSG